MSEEQSSTLPAVPAAPATPAVTVLAGGQPSSLQRRIRELAEGKDVPQICRESFSDEDWGAMPLEERMEAIAFMLSEQNETTRGLEITFPKIKYPTSQAGVWVVPGAGETPEYRPVIGGVVLYKQPVRAYWPVGNPISKDPPMCSSPDGRKPDTPGPIDAEKGRQADKCAECPRSVFGTGKDGQGQACKARINVFVMMDMNGHEPLKLPLELDKIPTLLSVPPSQLRAFSEYAVQIRKSGASLITNTTSFALKDDKNKGGTEFKALVLSKGKRLSYDQMRMCRSISDHFADQFRRRGFVPDDESAGGGGGGGGQEEEVPF